MEIKINCNVTEYQSFPDKENTLNIFHIDNNCLVIEFCNKEEDILNHSEISIEDAKKLAKIILNYENYENFKIEKN